MTEGVRTAGPPVGPMDGRQVDPVPVLARAREPRERAPTPRRRRIAYVHVPKCGGQSFEDVLRHAYWRWEDEEGAVPRYVQFFPDEMKISDQASVEIESAFEAADPDMLLERGDAFWGHLRYQLFRDKFAHRIGASLGLITVLRDPLELYASLYGYSTSYTEHPEHERLKQVSGFRDFMERQHVFPYQCSFVADVYTAREAIKVLEDRYLGYCVVEDLGDFGEMLLGYLDRPQIEVPRINVTGKSLDLVRTLKATDLEWFYNRAGEDYLLVQWARRTWRQHCARTMRLPSQGDADLERPDFRRVG